MDVNGLQALCKVNTHAYTCTYVGTDDFSGNHKRYHL